MSLDDRPRHYRPEVLSISETATVCNVTPRTVRRWIDAGTLPSIVLPSGRRAILEADLAGAVHRTPRRWSDRAAPQRAGRVKPDARRHLRPDPRIPHLRPADLSPTRTTATP